MSKMISEESIKTIVKTVLDNYQSTIRTAPIHKMTVVSTDATKTNYQHPQKLQKLGVFSDMNAAIQSAKIAQKALNHLKLSDRSELIEAIRHVALTHKEELAQEIIDETKLGNYEDKLQKIELVATKTPGIENLTIQAFSGDAGLTTVEYSPYGVIGAVTPVTNPVETILNNSIGMIASGNSVVFNVHPSSIKSSQAIIELMNHSIVERGGPVNLVTMVDNPTMATLETLMTSNDIQLLVGTGGPGLVKKLLQSGKKAIGAGAGNPPVLVDETADLAIAAQEIIKGASFDNNILCIAEKEVFVVESVADDLMYHFLVNQAVLLNSQQVKQLMDFALITDPNSATKKSCSGEQLSNFHVNKEWVGKNVQSFLKKLDITDCPNAKLIIFEADFCHPFVQLEQMMPILPIVRVKDVNEGIELAVKAEKGNRHTALMHSQNITNLTNFARAIESTIFVKNASSLAGVGFEGEGYTTMSIAGPTGEGLTSAKSFSRIRRCTLGQGGFSL